jgi:8-oxo-dGTP pyrophosphatase MutT (NUDIX family)
MSLPWRLRRPLYRAAYNLLRVYWWLARPTVSGVKFLLTDGERVLLVRHTYGDRRWDVPGGSLKRGEPPLHAARREAEEELGLSIADWRGIGVLTGHAGGRTDTLHCFAAATPARGLKLDRGEIEEAAWFAPDQLPARLSRYTQQIVALIS